jgi:hypothetical protein
MRTPKENMFMLAIESPNQIPKRFTGIALFPRGTKYWIKNGKRHREDGPAIEHSNGGKEWYFDDEYICSNLLLQSLDNNYIVLERSIPTQRMFGDIKITKARLLTAKGTVFVYDNIPGRPFDGE